MFLSKKIFLFFSLNLTWVRCQPHVHWMMCYWCFPHRIFDTRYSFNRSCKLKVQRYGTSYRLETSYPTDIATSPGTTFPDYLSLTRDIISCQAKGKDWHSELRGTCAFQFSGQATNHLYSDNPNTFLGRSSFTYPFKDPVLDRSIVRRRIQFDFDVKGGSSAFYGVFVNSIFSVWRSHHPYRYYVSGVFPDVGLVYSMWWILLLSTDKSLIID